MSTRTQFHEDGGDAESHGVPRGDDGPLPLAGIVVAGGTSRRLGQDKRRLRLWGAAGPTLLEYILGRLEPLCDERIVVLNDAPAWPGLPAHLVSDHSPDGGALGGIAAGLAAATCSYALVVAADMPLLNPALLRAMAARPRSYAALVPRTPPARAAHQQSRSAGGGPQRSARDAAAYVEPLHAIYSRACLPVLREALGQGLRRLSDVLGLLHVAFIEPEESAVYDPDGWSFLNINTPADLDLARRRIAEVSPPPVGQALPGRLPRP